jgi:two-component system, NarL family, nitrate/nitrite response regulator NarL
MSNVMTGVPTRVLIVDTQPIFRLGLLALLESAYPQWSVSESDSMAPFHGRLWEGAVDLLFIDSETLGKEAARNGSTRGGLSLVSTIIAITSVDDPILSMGCMSAGAHATIARTDSATRTLSTVDIMAVRYEREAASRGADALPAATPAAPTPTTEILNLTARQFDVLRLLAKGQSNKVIARDLGLSVSTVKVHLNTVFRALGARNRVEAVVRARPIQESIAQS